MFKVIGMGDEDELEELEMVWLREIYCVDKIILLLLISERGVTLGDNPLLLR
jgi:hypothetical protein